MECVPRFTAGPARLRRLGDGMKEGAFTRFIAVPLSPTIGAELSGVDLRQPVDDELFEELHRALLEWKVLFFRDQDLTSEQHVRFSRLWGELEVHPFLAQGDVPEIVRFAKDDKTKAVENVWHSDVSFRESPAMGSVLRAIEVPAVGGDTIWVDMTAAYDGLPDDVKDRIDGMFAVHDFAQSYGLGMSPEELAKARQELPPARHPVVRTHPETGRKILYVNEIFTSHIEGLAPDEGEAMLLYLCRQAAVPEYQCRFRWRVNSVALWDNRGTQHYALSDYWPHRRVMERAAIIGDKPF